MDVTIRRATPDDLRALERFYSELSDESRRLRFFSFARGISHGAARWFCAVDHRHREGLVATAEDPSMPGERIIVGHLCVEPNDGSAEIAIAVADAFQRRGIGRRLMGAGIAWARSVGIRRLTATTLESNVAIWRLLTGLGLKIVTGTDGPEVASASIDLDTIQPAAAAAA